MAAAAERRILCPKTDTGDLAETAMLMMADGGGCCFHVPRRYLIPSLDRAHAGQYRCIVRNRVGAIMQVTTEVQVACKFATFLAERGKRLLIKKFADESHRKEA